MTVKELMELLTKMDPDAEVYVETSYDEGHGSVGGYVEKEKVYVDVSGDVVLKV